MTQSDIVNIRKGQIAKKRSEYGKITRTKREQLMILLKRYFNGDSTVAVDIIRGYIPLVIDQIERNFLNCNASMTQLLEAGIEGIKKTLKTSNCAKIQMFFVHVNKQIQQSMINLFIEEKCVFFPVKDICYYELEDESKLIYVLKRKNLFETAIYFAKLILLKKMTIEEIGDLHHLDYSVVKKIMMRGLQIIDTNLLNRVKKELERRRVKSEFKGGRVVTIFTIYDFLKTSDEKSVKGFLSILMPEAREKILSVYPLYKNEMQKKEGITLNICKTDPCLYAQFLRLRKVYMAFTEGEEIHPYNLYLDVNIRKMNISHTYNAIEPSIVLEAIGSLNDKDKNFIFSVYDELGNLRFDFDTAAGFLDMPIEEFEKRMFNIRKSIKTRINKIMGLNYEYFPDEGKQREHLHPLQQKKEKS